MDFLIEKGYQFEILEGYTFTPKAIFKDFMEALYKTTIIIS